MKTKRLTVMMIPHGRSSVKEFSISYRSIWMTIVGLAILLGLLSFYAVGYHAKLIQEIQLQQLASERDALIAQIQQMDGDIDVLKQSLEELFEHNNRLRLLADLQELDSDTRQVGIGGPAYEDSSTTSVFSPRSQRLIARIQSDIDRLLRQADLERVAFEEIERKLKGDQSLRDHTPSIRPCQPCYPSSGFGMRRDPFTGRRRMHHGLDLAGHRGTPICATANGKVARIQQRRTGLGWTVQVDHQYGYGTLYGHLSRILVKKGDRVDRGQKIAEMGSTGRSTAPHLHYEVHRKGRPVNPWHYIVEEDKVAQTAISSLP